MIMICCAGSDACMGIRGFIAGDVDFVAAKVIAAIVTEDREESEVLKKTFLDILVSLIC